MDEINSVILDRLANAIYDKAFKIAKAESTSVEVNEYEVSSNVDLIIEKLIDELDITEKQEGEKPNE
jgi:hypothetical protein